MIKAQELAEKHGYFYPNQFENEANAWIHEHTTGPEIVRAFEGKKLDHFVTAYGTVSKKTLFIITSYRKMANYQTFEAFAIANLLSRPFR